MAENLCAPFYADNIGHPGLAPGVYFHMLFIGHFQAINADMDDRKTINATLDLARDNL